MLMKKCGKCGETKEKSEFYKDNRAPDKLEYRCKQCHNSYKYLPVPGITEKECYDCSEVKSFEDFNMCWSGKYGRLNYCKPCASIRYKSSRQTDEYREKAKEWSRKFRRENPDRVLEYDYYIASTMCNETNDLTKEDITPGMIKLQRKSLKLRREYYKLKNECNE